MPNPTNEIKKISINSLGYNFIKPAHIPEGKDEYYLRNMQNRSGISYRKLTAFEIEVLVRNRNTSDDWANILVSDSFNPELVKNCKFYGLIRIGKLESYYLEFSDLKVPVGIYNSTIISCDFGDNVVVENIDYMANYIIGNEVILVNVNELVTTNHAKFGNGILKVGEEEKIRIWMELCNENGGRKVLPFTGMLPGDAWLWSKYRDDQALLQKFKEFTDARFDTQRGYYGKIGDRTVIKNCNIIKDVWVGTDAYLKGANKLKNLTINSEPGAKSQIGEGVEMVNGIMEKGCKAFYGIKAVRFMMGSHSQLKYGARLINSFLGDNSTISCCEVLNSLILPAHEQHHNNSFLCASLIMGQSNIAAGATIGSNHNSRSPDGELIAGRGFWPGLCVSLKHNSRFATFTMLAKGDYPAELDIPIPFCLISNEVSKDQLTIMPGYWYMYNMYALERNAWKYTDRDKRKEKIPFIEYDHLAPDTINEMLHALELFKLYTGKAYIKSKKLEKTYTTEEAVEIGKKLLESNKNEINDLEITVDGFENSKRKVVLIKVLKAYQLFTNLVKYYTTNRLVNFIIEHKIQNFNTLIDNIPNEIAFNNWINVGGQLIQETEVQNLIHQVKKGTISSWEDIHNFYRQQGNAYEKEKFLHALAAFEKLTGKSIKKIEADGFSLLLKQAISTKEWMTKGISDSRTKDYTNPFRKMVYANNQEMENVLGKLSDNTFIKMKMEELKNFKTSINKITEVFGS